MSWPARAARARVLAERYPASREALGFFAALADWLADAPAASAEELLPGLLALAERCGPEELRRRAREAQQLGEDDPWNFFGRVCRMAAAARSPGCAGPPQAGVLVPEAEGQALLLVCGRCLGRRRFPRGRCPGCEQQTLVYFSAPELAHLRLQACESCRTYVVLVDLAADPEAIPEVDEIAALPLDLWAREHGYRRLYPGLAGV